MDLRSWSTFCNINAIIVIALNDEVAVYWRPLTVVYMLYRQEAAPRPSLSPAQRMSDTNYFQVN